MEVLLGKPIEYWVEVKAIMDMLDIETADELKAVLNKDKTYKLLAENIKLKGQLNEIENIIKEN